MIHSREKSFFTLVHHQPCIDMKNLHRLLSLSFAFFTACTPMKKEREENIDHIILAINDLDKGIAQFKELTGIEPVFGGIHPFSFSHNALVALDNETYIEIMAPRPDAENVPADFLSMEKLTPIGWAVRTRHVNQTKEKLKAAGFVTSESKDGSRTKPDGTKLSWTTFGIEQHDDFPFFIEWGAGTTHPSKSSPVGCTLSSFTIITPNETMNKLNATLQLGLTVSQGNDTQWQLTIDTPKGKVTF
jgi:hypothetical protein